jgi:light-regulated signal transduction histidine kinase (bacteriophytochrome)
MGEVHELTQAPEKTAAEEGLDLTSCDREPIHIPGSIQPHGFLLALDPETMVVCEASENAAAYLERPLSEIFGRTLPEVLGAERGERMLVELRSHALTTATRLLTGLALQGNGEQRTFEAVVHRTSTAGEGEAAERIAERIIVECEQSFEPVDVEALNSQLYNFVSANRGQRSETEVMRAAVRELRSLTGCGRVVLYRFDEEGHGIVLAEERDPEYASYLGLRFPASDVPQQARRMYALNRVRIIPNVDYLPSPLLSVHGPARDLDLSSSVLRSVSPVHRAYMRNMGTACSMSVSILINGKLWGLVSCHDHEPRYVPLRLRSAADFMIQVMSAQMESQQNGRHLQRVVQSRAVQGRLLGAMAARSNYMDGLLENPHLLMELVQADGVAVVVGNKAHLFGTTPSESHVMRLTEWLRRQESDEVFVSHRLSEMYGAARAFTGTGSGVIAASLSKLYSTQVLWFRQELVSTVRWAGDPQKPAQPARGDSQGAVVDPRHSFEEWLQIVRAQSAPWTLEDRLAASEFRGSVLEIVLRRAEELADMAAGLKVANEELEAFSYSVSHDLRAPFRHISGFSEMLREEEAERMSAKGLHYLNTIMESAHFAGMLVDSLLDFSRIARVKIHTMSVGMEELFDSEWSAVMYDEGRDREVEYQRGALPRVMADPQLMRQVVRNLLSNAVKYTGKQEAPRVEVTAGAEGQEFVFAVRDNGVGFDQKYAGKLFGVFQRLHRVEDFEGTGIGLANVRRIVSRHGGRTWAEAEVGKGATFFFSMPAIFREEGL